MTLPSIAARVKSCRDRLGWTEGGVSRHSGVPVERIEEIERRGSLPTVPELFAIAKALGVTCDVLVGMKLPATVTVGDTTVTISVSVVGLYSNDRIVMQRTKECADAIKRSLSGPPAPDGSVPTEYRELHDLVRRERNVSAMHAERVTAAQTRINGLESALRLERQATAHLRAEIARLQSAAHDSHDEQPRTEP